MEVTKDSADPAFTRGSILFPSAANAEDNHWLGSPTFDYLIGAPSWKMRFSILSRRKSPWSLFSLGNGEPSSINIKVGMGGELRITQVGRFDVTSEQPKVSSSGFPQEIIISFDQGILEVLIDGEVCFSQGGAVPQTTPGIAIGGPPGPTYGALEGELSTVEITFP